MASIVLPLALDRAAWMRRRTDRVSLLKGDVVRREVTLEFRIPDICELMGEEVWLNTIPITLALHQKRVLTGFRLVDAGGTEMSLLTKAEDQPIMQRMLVALAEAVLGRPPLSGIKELLLKVTESSEVAHQAREDLTASAEGLALTQDDSMRALLDDLTDDFLMLALVPYEIGAEHVITFTYDEYLEREAQPRPRLWEFHRWLQRAGWLPSRPGPVKLTFPLGQAASFHAELTSPPELEFPVKPDLQWHHEGDEPHHEVQNLGDLLVLYVAGANRGDRVRMVTDFRNSLSGVSRSAEVITVLTFLVFAVSLLCRRLFGVTPTGDAAAASAILVSLPAVYAILALREERHPLTAQYTEFPRAAIAGAGVLALLGGVVLATGWPGPPAAMARVGVGWRSVAWAGITLLLLVLAIVTFRARRTSGR